MSYELSTDAYAGPIEKLLELVEERRLEITCISLARVTAEFFTYIEKLRVLEEAHSDDTDLKTVIADFLVVAARLVLIKAQALIPNLPLEAEDREDIADLEFRLKLYQELKGGRQHIARTWRSLPYMFSREYLMTRTPVFLPPPRLAPADLDRALRALVKELEHILRPVTRIEREVLNLKEKIEEMLRRITNAPTSLRNLSSTETKGELVVLFLAVLHLVKDHMVYVEQPQPFGDIVIAKRTEKQ